MAKNSTYSIDELAAELKISSSLVKLCLKNSLDGMELLASSNPTIRLSDTDLVRVKEYVAHHRDEFPETSVPAGNKPVIPQNKKPVVPQNKQQKPHENGNAPRLETADVILLGHSIFTKVGSQRLLEWLKRKIENGEITAKFYVTSVCVKTLSVQADFEYYLPEERERLKYAVDFLREMQAAGKMEVIPRRFEDSDVTEYGTLEHFIVYNLMNSKKVFAIFDDYRLNKTLKRHIEDLRSNQNRKPEITIRTVSEDGKPIRGNAGITPAFAAIADQRRSPLSDTPVTLKGELPGKNAVVYDENGTEYRLCGGDSGSGLEGAVYGAEGHPDKLIKIFGKDFQTPLKHKTVSLLLEKRDVLYSHNPRLAARLSLPEHIIRNSTGEPVGYMMTKFADMLPKGTAMNYQMLGILGFGDFMQPKPTRAHLVRMAYSLAEIVEFANAENICLGDILNDKNILFDKNQVAHLIDLDSAQLADDTYWYPSGVGTWECLSPEHITDERGEADYSFRRKIADDSWALQLAIFTLMHGKGPYDYINYVGNGRDVKNGIYVYQTSMYQATRDERYRRDEEVETSVSHMTPELKDAFFNAFHKINGKKYLEDRRQGARDWRNMLHYYYYMIPVYLTDDSNANDPRPTEFRNYKAPQPTTRLVISSGIPDTAPSAAIPSTSWEQLPNQIAKKR